MNETMAFADDGISDKSLTLLANTCDFIVCYWDPRDKGDGSSSSHTRQFHLDT